MGAAEGCGSALQVECLEGIVTPGLHQVFESRQAKRYKEVTDRTYPWQVTDFQLLMTHSSIG